MPRRLWSNYARCKLGADIVTTGTLATITVETGKGALFPSPAGGDWFILAVEDASKNLEFFRIVGRTGDILTVGGGGTERAQEGSTARTFTAATSICGLRPTQDFFDRTELHLGATVDAHDASAISYAGGTGIAADNVEGAIDELAAEKANLDSPAFTGNPTAPTPADGDNDTSIATTAFVMAMSLPRGTPVPTFLSAAPTGWVLCRGRTIGNGSSGATERANADTQMLFELLWNNLADTEAPVSGGRGGSAAADFAANKTIALPDLRGRTLAGVDDMGTGAASRLTAAVSGIADRRGAAGGDQNLAQHNHGITDPGHEHAGGAQPGSVYVPGGGPFNSASPGQQNTASATTGITVNNAGTGAAANVQPTMRVNWMLRL